MVDIFKNKYIYSFLKSKNFTIFIILGNCKVKTMSLTKAESFSFNFKCTLKLKLTIKKKLLT